MSATLQFDDEASRRIEAIYSTPDVVAQRQAVLLALEAKPGERVLDIGAGPLPSVMNALQSVNAPIDELQPRPRHQVLDGPGDEQLLGFGSSADAGSDMHGDPDSAIIIPGLAVERSRRPQNAVASGSPAWLGAEISTIDPSPQ